MYIKKWVVVVGGLVIFFVGFGAAPKQIVDTKYVDREVVKEVKTNEVPKEWKDLKETDDTSFKLIFDAYALCAKGYQEVALGNYKNVSSTYSKIRQSDKELDALGAKRQEILKKLGY